MTQDDPMLRLRYYRETGQSDQAALYERYLKETGQWQADAPASPLHEEYTSGRLAKRMARENASDKDMLDAGGSVASQIGHGILGAASAVPNIIPGAERALAGVRSVVRGQPYEEAVGDIKAAKDVAGKPAVALATALPAVAALGAGGGATVLGRNAPALIQKGMQVIGALSPAKAGAAFAGTSAALDSAPITGPNGEGIAGRVKDTALSAGLGAGLGAGLEHGSVALKSKLAEKTLTNIAKRIRETRAAAEPLYDAFRGVGDLGATKMLDKITQLPVVSSAIKTVKGMSPELAGLSDTHSRVLDAARKMLGKKAWQASQGGVETGQAVKALDAAIEDALQTVAPGVSHKAAVSTYAKGMSEAEGVKRGSQAVRYAARPQAQETKNAMEFGEDGFKAWLEKATPEQRAAAIEGIKGRLKVSPLWGRSGSVVEGIKGSRFLPSVELREGTRLLRELGEPMVPTSWLSALRRPVLTPHPMGGGNMGGVGQNAGGSVGQVTARLAQPSNASGFPARPAGPAGTPPPITDGPRLLPSETPGTAANRRFSAPRALLPARARWGHGPDTPSTVTLAGEAPPVMGPAIPTMGPEEQAKQAIRLAQESRLASGKATTPISLEEFLRQRDIMEPPTDANFYRRLADLLRQIHTP